MTKNIGGKLANLMKPVNLFKAHLLGDTIIEATQREDGSWRKPVKIRPGFKPPELV